MTDLNLENVLVGIRKDLTKNKEKKNTENKEDDNKFLEDLANNTPNSEMFESTDNDWQINL